jgi:uncharacterized protein (DUF2147 family)
MRPAIFFSGVLLVTSLTPALAADPNRDWQVAEGVANIRVAQCNGNMWGVVVWEKEPGGHDGNNPDASKKDRPTLGMPILLDMKKKAGSDQWEGQVYNAKDGQTYSSTITPTDSDHMEIRGCVLGFLCGGETWTRVGPPIPSGPANSMAKGMAPKGGVAPKHATAGTAPARTTGSVAGQKTAGKPADAVGDICLLPDVAGLAH